MPGKINNKPNPWGVINDYSKTVITLATGFLALTITFSGHLLGRQNPRGLLCLLIGCWVLLVFAIICGLLAAAFLSNFLRGKRSSKLLMLCSNAAFFSLMGAGVLFLIFGAVQVSTQTIELDATKAIEQVHDIAPIIYKNVDGYWEVESLIWDDTKEEWKSVISFSSFSDEKKTKNKFLVIIDAKRCKIIKFSKINSAADDPN